MGWNYLWLHHWSFQMDKWLHSALNNGCNYVSMLGLEGIHICKKGPRPYCIATRRSPLPQSTTSSGGCRCLTRHSTQPSLMVTCHSRHAATQLGFPATSTHQSKLPVQICHSTGEAQSLTFQELGTFIWIFFSCYFYKHVFSGRWNWSNTCNSLKWCIYV